MRLPRFASIDIFSGAGGLSAALERAGFTTVAAVDADADCIATLRKNKSKLIEGGNRRYLDQARLLCADIAEVGANDLRPSGVGANWRPALLAGGPPCQPFSHAGLGLALEDPRGRLFQHFVRLADELNPHYVLFENVAGLVTSKCAEGIAGGALLAVQRAFEAKGFACKFALLNAADFGAPQRRVRLYMIGSRDGTLPSFPSPTNSRTPMNGLRPWTSLAEAVATLSPPPADQVVKPTGRRASELLALQPGNGLRSGGMVEANRPGGHWGYRQDCFVADPSLPSRTIRAATTPDWVNLDHHGLRRLTATECAVLQDFPASWEFEGARASQFRQIGNAVQGRIGCAVAREILAVIEHDRIEKPQSEPWPANFHKRVRYTAMEQRVNGQIRAIARAGRDSERRINVG